MRSFVRVRFPAAAFTLHERQVGWMNLRDRINRLQTALRCRGRYIRINQMQYYSEKTERIGTVYQVCETVTDKNGRKKNEIYCKSPKLADVLLTLIEIYEDGE